MCTSIYHRVFWAWCTDSPSTQGLDSSFAITLSHGATPLSAVENSFLIAALPGPAGETGFGKKGPGHELFTRRFLLLEPGGDEEME